MNSITKTTIAALLCGTVLTLSAANADIPRPGSLPPGFSIADFGLTYAEWIKYFDNQDFMSQWSPDAISYIKQQVNKEYKDEIDRLTKEAKAKEAKDKETKDKETKDKDTGQLEPWNMTEAEAIRHVVSTAPSGITASQLRELIMAMLQIRTDHQSENSVPVVTPILTPQEQREREARQFLIDTSDGNLSEADIEGFMAKWRRGTLFGPPGAMKPPLPSPPNESKPDEQSPEHGLPPAIPNDVADEFAAQIRLALEERGLTDKQLAESGPMTDEERDEKYREADELSATMFAEMVKGWIARQSPPPKPDTPAKTLAEQAATYFMNKYGADIGTARNKYLVELWNNDGFGSQIDPDYRDGYEFLYRPDQKVSVPTSVLQQLKEEAEKEALAHGLSENQLQELYLQKVKDWRAKNPPEPPPPLPTPSKEQLREILAKLNQEQRKVLRKGRPDLYAKYPSLFSDALLRETLARMTPNQREILGKTRPEWVAKFPGLFPTIPSPDESGNKGQPQPDPSGTPKGNEDQQTSGNENKGPELVQPPKQLTNEEKVRRLFLNSGLENEELEAQVERWKAGSFPVWISGVEILPPAQPTGDGSQQTSGNEDTESEDEQTTQTNEQSQGTPIAAFLDETTLRAINFWNDLLTNGDITQSQYQEAVDAIAMPAFNRATGSTPISVSGLPSPADKTPSDTQIDPEYTETERAELDHWSIMLEQGKITQQQYDEFTKPIIALASSRQINQQDPSTSPPDVAPSDGAPPPVFTEGESAERELLQTKFEQNKISQEDYDAEMDAIARRASSRVAAALGVNKPTTGTPPPSQSNSDSGDGNDQTDPSGTPKNEDKSTDTPDPVQPTAEIPRPASLHPDFSVTSFDWTYAKWQEMLENSKFLSEFPPDALPYVRQLVDKVFKDEKERLAKEAKAKEQAEKARKAEENRLLGLSAEDWDAHMDALEQEFDAGNLSQEQLDYYRGLQAKAFARTRPGGSESTTDENKAESGSSDPKPTGTPPPLPTDEEIAREYFLAQPWVIKSRISTVMEEWRNGVFWHLVQDGIIPAPPPTDEEIAREYFLEQPWVIKSRISTVMEDWRNGVFWNLVQDGVIPAPPPPPRPAAELAREYFQAQPWINPSELIRAMQTWSKGGYNYLARVGVIPFPPGQEEEGIPDPLMPWELTEQEAIRRDVYTAPEEMPKEELQDLIMWVLLMRTDHQSENSVPVNPSLTPREQREAEIRAHLDRFVAMTDQQKEWYLQQALSVLPPEPDESQPDEQSPEYGLPPAIPNDVADKFAAQIRLALEERGLTDKQLAESGPMTDEERDEKYREADELSATMFAEMVKGWIARQSPPPKPDTPAKTLAEQAATFFMNKYGADIGKAWNKYLVEVWNNDGFDSQIDPKYKDGKRFLYRPDKKVSVPTDVLQQLKEEAEKEALAHGLSENQLQELYLQKVKDWRAKNPPEPPPPLPTPSKEQLREILAKLNQEQRKVLRKGRPDLYAKYPSLFSDALLRETLARMTPNQREILGKTRPEWVAKFPGLFPTIPSPDESGNKGQPQPDPSGTPKGNEDQQTSGNENKGPELVQPPKQLTNEEKVRRLFLNSGLENEELEAQVERWKAGSFPVWISGVEILPPAQPTGDGSQQTSGNEDTESEDEQTTQTNEQSQGTPIAAFLDETTLRAINFWNDLLTNGDITQSQYQEAVDAIAMPAFNRATGSTPISVSGLPSPADKTPSDTQIDPEYTETERAELDHWSIMLEQGKITQQQYDEFTKPIIALASSRQINQQDPSTSPPDVAPSDGAPPPVFTEGESAERELLQTKFEQNKISQEDYDAEMDAIARRASSRVAAALGVDKPTTGTPPPSQSNSDSGDGNDQTDPSGTPKNEDKSTDTPDPVQPTAEIPRPASLHPDFSVTSFDWTYAKWQEMLENSKFLSEFPPDALPYVRQLVDKVFKDEKERLAKEAKAKEQAEKARKAEENRLLGLSAEDWDAHMDALEQEFDAGNLSQEQLDYYRGLQAKAFARTRPGGSESTTDENKAESGSSDPKPTGTPPPLPTDEEIAREYFLAQPWVIKSRISTVMEEWRNGVFWHLVQDGIIPAPPPTDEEIAREYFLAQPWVIKSRISTVMEDWRNGVFWNLVQDGVIPAPPPPPRPAAELAREYFQAQPWINPSELIRAMQTWSKGGYNYLARVGVIPFPPGQEEEGIPDPLMPWELTEQEAIRRVVYTKPEEMPKEELQDLIMWVLLMRTDHQSENSVPVNPSLTPREQREAEIRAHLDRFVAMTDQQKEWYLQQALSVLPPEPDESKPDEQSPEYGLPPAIPNDVADEFAAQIRLALEERGLTDKQLAESGPMTDEERDEKYREADELSATMFAEMVKGWIARQSPPPKPDTPAKTLAEQAATFFMNKYGADIGKAWNKYLVEVWNNDGFDSQIDPKYKDGKRFLYRPDKKVSVPTDVLQQLKEEAEKEALAHGLSENQLQELYLQKVKDWRAKNPPEPPPPLPTPSKEQLRETLAVLTPEQIVTLRDLRPEWVAKFPGLFPTIPSPDESGNKGQPQPDPSGTPKGNEDQQTSGNENKGPELVQPPKQLTNEEKVRRLFLNSGLENEELEAQVERWKAGSFPVWISGVEILPPAQPTGNEDQQTSGNENKGPELVRPPKQLTNEEKVRRLFLNSGLENEELEAQVERWKAGSFPVWISGVEILPPAQPTGDGSQQTSGNEDTESEDEQTTQTNEQSQGTPIAAFLDETTLRAINFWNDLLTNGNITEDQYQEAVDAIAMPAFNRATGSTPISVSGLPSPADKTPSDTQIDPEYTETERAELDHWSIMLEQGKITQQQYDEFTKPIIALASSRQINQQDPSTSPPDVAPSDGAPPPVFTEGESAERELLQTKFEQNKISQEDYDAEMDAIARRASSRIAAALGVDKPTVESKTIGAEKPTTGTPPPSQSNSDSGDGNDQTDPSGTPKNEDKSTDAPDGSEDKGDKNKNSDKTNFPKLPAGFGEPGSERGSPPPRPIGREGKDGRVDFLPDQSKGPAVDENSGDNDSKGKGDQRTSGEENKNPNPLSPPQKPQTAEEIAREFFTNTRGLVGEELEIVIRQWANGDFYTDTEVPPPPTAEYVGGVTPDPVQPTAEIPPPLGRSGSGQAEVDTEESTDPTDELAGGQPGEEDAGQTDKVDPEIQIGRSVDPVLGSSEAKTEEVKRESGSTTDENKAESGSSDPKPTGTPPPSQSNSDSGDGNDQTDPSGTPKNEDKSTDAPDGSEDKGDKNKNSDKTNFPKLPAAFGEPGSERGSPPPRPIGREGKDGRVAFLPDQSKGPAVDENSGDNDSKGKGDQRTSGEENKNPNPLSPPQKPQTAEEIAREFFTNTRGLVGEELEIVIRQWANGDFYTDTEVPPPPTAEYVGGVTPDPVQPTAEIPPPLGRSGSGQAEVDTEESTDPTDELAGGQPGEEDAGQTDKVDPEIQIGRSVDPVLGSSEAKTEEVKRESGSTTDENKAESGSSDPKPTGTPPPSQSNSDSGDGNDQTDPSGTPKLPAGFGEPGSERGSPPPRPIGREGKDGRVAFLPDQSKGPAVDENSGDNDSKGKGDQRTSGEENKNPNPLSPPQKPQTAEEIAREFFTNTRGLVGEELEIVIRQWANGDFYTDTEVPPPPTAEYVGGVTPDPVQPTAEIPPPLGRSGSGQAEVDTEESTDPTDELAGGQPGEEDAGQTDKVDPEIQIGRSVDPVLGSSEAKTEEVKRESGSTTDENKAESGSSDPKPTGTPPPSQSNSDSGDGNDQTDPSGTPKLPAGFGEPGSERGSPPPRPIGREGKDGRVDFLPDQSKGPAVDENSGDNDSKGKGDQRTSGEENKNPNPLSPPQKPQTAEEIAREFFTNTRGLVGEELEIVIRQWANGDFYTDTEVPPPPTAEYVGGVTPDPVQPTAEIPPPLGRSGSGQAEVDTEESTDPTDELAGGQPGEEDAGQTDKVDPEIQIGRSVDPVLGSSEAKTEEVKRESGSTTDENKAESGSSDPKPTGTPPPSQSNSDSGDGNDQTDPSGTPKLPAGFGEPGSERGSPPPRPIGREGKDGRVDFLPDQSKGPAVDENSGDNDSKGKGDQRTSGEENKNPNPLSPPQKPQTAEEIAREFFTNTRGLVGEELEIVIRQWANGDFYTDTEVPPPPTAEYVGGVTPDPVQPTAEIPPPLGRSGSGQAEVDTEESTDPTDELAGGQPGEEDAGQTDKVDPEIQIGRSVDPVLGSSEAKTEEVKRESGSTTDENKAESGSSDPKPTGTPPPSQSNSDSGDGNDQTDPSGTPTSPPPSLLPKGKVPDHLVPNPVWNKFNEQALGAQSRDGLTDKERDEFRDRLILAWLAEQGGDGSSIPGQPDDSKTVAVDPDTPDGSTVDPYRFSSEAPPTEEFLTQLVPTLSPEDLGLLAATYPDLVARYPTMFPEPFLTQLVPTLSPEEVGALANTYPDYVDQFPHLFLRGVTWIDPAQFDYKTITPDPIVRVSYSDIRIENKLSIGPRFGFAHERFYFYGKGGYMQADVSLSRHTDTITHTFTDAYLGPHLVNRSVSSSTSSQKERDWSVARGYFVGAGVDWAWTDNIILGIEYTHEEPGAVTILGKKVDLGTNDTIMARFTYKF